MSKAEFLFIQGQQGLQIQQVCDIELDGAGGKE